MAILLLRKHGNAVLSCQYHGGGILAYNGSGTFARVHDWTTDLGNTVPVTASRMDAEMDGMATGLSTCICKDGQTTTTARIPFAAGASVMDGSVSAPGLSFSSDSNCGIYRIGTDNVGLTVGGTKIIDLATTGAAVTGTLSCTSTFTSTGALTASSTANVVGNFSVATNKFNVTAASGNTAVAGTLSVTGVADFADGTNSLPSIANTGDLNTGVYFPAADEVGITAGGTQRARFTSAGAIVTGALTASTSIAATTSITAGNGFTVSAGTVTLPADSVAAAALAAPAAWVCIETQAASNDATIDFETGLGDTTYDAFCFVLSNVKPASDDVELWLRVGTGVGPTYQAGASDYSWTNTSLSDTADSEIHIAAGGAGNAVGNASGESISATVWFDNPEATNFPLFRGTASWITSGGALGGGAVNGAYLTAAAVTGIRFLFESGNISSGRFSLYGLTKTA